MARQPLIFSFSGHRGVRFPFCQKGIKRGSVISSKRAKTSGPALGKKGDVKKVPNGRLQGLDPGKPSSGIFRFGYRKASSDRNVPDPVDSGFLISEDSIHDASSTCGGPA